MSAGSHPTGQVHPRSLALLAREGISTDGLHSKSWDDLPVTPDIVVTVCASAAGETCPAYLGPGAAHALGRRRSGARHRHRRRNRRRVRARLPHPARAHRGVSRAAARRRSQHDQPALKAAMDRIAAHDRLGSLADMSARIRRHRQAGRQRAAELLRALPHRLGRRCASSSASPLGQFLPGAVPGDRPHGDRQGQPAGRPADLGDDHPDAAEGRLRRAAPGARGTSAASA